MWQMASCTFTASNVLPRRSVRMSPRMCSQSGLSLRLTFSICGDMSTSVISKRALRWKALLPPPEPSSSTVRGGGLVDLRRTLATWAASSRYPFGSEKTGHHPASSP